MRRIYRAWLLWLAWGDQREAQRRVRRLAKKTDELIRLYGDVWEEALQARVDLQHAEAEIRRLEEKGAATKALQNNH